MQKKIYIALKQADYNRLRLVEIDSYQRDSYRAYGNLMRMIAIFCVPILLFALLANSNLIPQTFLSKNTVHNIASLGISLFLLVGVYYVGRYWWDISHRNNMNFNEYDWNFDPDAQAPSVIQYDEAQLMGGYKKFKKGAGDLLREGTKLGGSELGLQGYKCPKKYPHLKEWKNTNSWWCYKNTDQTGGMCNVKTEASAPNQGKWGHYKHAPNCNK